MALDLFAAMGQAVVEPDTITYSAAISACEKNAEWRMALDLFAAMGRALVEPNAITYNAAISACEKAAEWWMALDIFAAMGRAVVEPNAITYSAAISACEKAAEWQKALSLFCALQEDSGCATSAVSYNAVLQAVHPYPIGKHLIARGLAKGLYDGLYMKGEGCLDLRNLSPGAAWLAVMRFFDTTGRSFTHVTLITGWGKQRQALDTTDVKTFICSRFNERHMRWHFNKGRLSV